MDIPDVNIADPEIRVQQPEISKISETKTCREQGVTNEEEPPSENKIEHRSEKSNPEKKSSYQQLLDLVPRARDWSSSELDPNYQVTPLDSYVDDKEFLAEKLFSLLSPKEILNEAQNIGFQNPNIEQVEQWCREQMALMSSSDLVAVINRQENSESEKIEQNLFEAQTEVPIPIKSDLPNNCEESQTHNTDSKTNVIADANLSDNDPTVHPNDEEISPTIANEVTGDKKVGVRTELEQIEIETRARLVQSILTKRYSPPAPILDDSSSESSSDSSTVVRRHHKHRES